MKIKTVALLHLSFFIKIIYKMLCHCPMAITDYNVESYVSSTVIVYSMDTLDARYDQT